MSSAARQAGAWDWISPTWCEPMALRSALTSSTQPSLPTGGPHGHRPGEEMGLDPLQGAGSGSTQKTSGETAAGVLRDGPGSDEV